MALILTVGLGGFMGSILRYLLGEALITVSTSGFPVPTLTVNLIGSLMMGIMLFLGQDKLGQYGFYFLVPGLLGGFTTYSAFSGEFMMLLKIQLFSHAGLYVLTTVLGGLLATTIGFLVSRALFSPS